MAAQQQFRREEDQISKQEPIKYGDVFFVSGKMAEKTILPMDGSAMESAEKAILGRTPIGGPASLMKSAALMNVEAGVVDPERCDITERIRVTESDLGAHNVIVTESIGDQVLGQYVETKIKKEVDEEDLPPSPTPSPVTGVRVGGEKEAITIGEALEAVILSAGEQPINRAEAAAIVAAEKRALGARIPPNNGLGIQAQDAADYNAQTSSHQLKATLDDVLQDASDKLSKDKAVTQEDAEEIVKAEIRHVPDMATTTGGVGEMMATAAKVNHP